jgi:hypothetical protein
MSFQTFNYQVAMYIILSRKKKKKTFFKQTNIFINSKEKKTHVLCRSCVTYAGPGVTNFLYF